MSRLLHLAVTTTLLGLSACTSVQETPSPAPAAPVAPAVTIQPPAPPATRETSEQTPPQPAPAIPPKPASEPAATPRPTPAPAAKPAPSASKPPRLTQEQALALAGKGNCLACHKIEARLVGPAWKAVAAKYQGAPSAATLIAANIKKGGSFGWKFGNMPAKGGSSLSEADIASLAEFIAGLK